MTINEEICASRNCGVVRCGLSLSSTTVPELAREFGLRDDLSSYKEIDEETARRLVRLILHQDMAYHSDVMPAARAAELADRFLGQFAAGARFFTNGNFYEERKKISDSAWSGPSWNPVTEATFDTGLLVLATGWHGCLWIEDED